MVVAAESTLGVSLWSVRGDLTQALSEVAPLAGAIPDELAIPTGPTLLGTIRLDRVPFLAHEAQPVGGIYENQVNGGFGKPRHPFATVTLEELNMHDSTLPVDP